MAYLALSAGSSDRGSRPSVESGTAPSKPAAPRETWQTPDAPETTVSLAPAVIERAGVRVAEVSTRVGASTLTLPGTVEPDAYRVVSVTPLAAGRVTRVHAQLGDLVHRGQTLAEVFSPELAEAHTRYVAARAELEAHDRELRRTERLVEIGAASRAELERTHAEHTAQTAGVASARSRLELLGAAPAVLDDPSPAMRLASIRVPAPIQGVVTERRANVGLNVDAADALFTVVDLSSVWVVANVYEKDFRRVQVGGAAAVRTQAYPDLVFRGRVAYLDPQMDLATRTARLRVEVPKCRMPEESCAWACTSTSRSPETASRRRSWCRASRSRSLVTATSSTSPIHASRAGSRNGPSPSAVPKAKTSRSRKD
jgi:RND family efflux transporter MFP subunit